MYAWNMHKNRVWFPKERKSILGFHMTSRPPCWCPKQRKGGHVGAPTKSSGNLTLLLCKRFLLFSLKNMAVDHVSENQQLCLYTNMAAVTSRENDLYAKRYFIFIFIFIFCEVSHRNTEISRVL